HEVNWPSVAKAIQWLAPSRSSATKGRPCAPAPRPASRRKGPSGPALKLKRVREFRALSTRTCIERSKKGHEWLLCRPVARREGEHEHGAPARQSPAGAVSAFDQANHAIEENHRLVRLTDELDWTELDLLAEEIRRSKLNSEAGRPPHL